MSFDRWNAPCSPLKRFYLFATRDEIVARVRSMRQVTELSQPAYAALIGVSTSAVIDWENGVNLPPHYVLQLIEELACHASWEALDTVRDAKKSAGTLEVLASAGETAERVKAARRRHGDTQDEFAWRLDVSLYRVQQWERGRSPLPIYVLRLIEFYVAYHNNANRKKRKYRRARIEVPTRD